LLSCPRVEAQPTAPPTATNHVLDLDDHGSYLELPPHLFDTFSNATVEAWVK